MSNSPQTKKRTDMSTPIIYNTDKWIEENKKFFNPPVCNKMMHNEGQMKMFYVGGPNQRKDYHIEEGEELFYMLKGDMCLKVVEQGKHRDVPIKEGEIFLLPGCIAHSPQRQANTIGLVIERDRDPEEQDGLRYFVEKDGKPTLESLYEKWFHCEDLGSQLAPIIKGFFASEQFKTGVPLAGTIPENPPIVLDSKTKLQDPFSLANFIEDNKSTLEEKGSVNIFGSDGGSQFQVDLFAEGENTGKCDRAETLIWQIKGKSAVTVDDKEYDVVENDTMLIRQGQKYKAKRGPDSIALICFQDPKRKKK